MDKILQSLRRIVRCHPAPHMSMRITCDVGGFELFWPPTPTLGRSSDKAAIFAGETKRPCSKSETKPFFQRPFFCLISLLKSHWFFSQKLCVSHRDFAAKGLSIFKTEMFFHKSSSIFTKSLPLPLRLWPFSQSLLLTRPYLVFKG